MNVDRELNAAVAALVEMARANPDLPADDPAFRRAFAALLVAAVAEST